MNKKYLIYGGGTVAAIVVFVIWRIHSANVAAASSNAANTTTDTQPVSTTDLGGIYSALSPISGGYTSTDSSTPVATTTAAVDTSTAGGGFDLTSLMTGLLGSQATSQQATTTANQQTDSTAILSTILGTNSSVSVTNGANGTTISNGNSPTIQTITDEYQQYLGRAPDAAGLAYWNNQLLNQPGFGIADLTVGIKQSQEYQADQAKATSTPATTTTASK